MSTHKPIPDGILRSHVLQALADLDHGTSHDFGEPSHWLLVEAGREYAPKAAVGLAAFHTFGRRLSPDEFSSGEGPRQAVGFLRSLGFTVVPKSGAPEPSKSVHQRDSFTNPERAAQLWHMLIAAARDRRTFTYALISEITGAFPPGLGAVLGHLMRYCQRNGLPPLTVLVVQSATGKPGAGLLTSVDHDEDRESVYAFDCYGRKAPLPSELAAV